MIITILVLLCFATFSVHSVKKPDENLRVHDDEGYYEFPLSLGGELTMATGRCAVGGQVYENCFVKLHSYGISVHAADKTLSSIPIILFQSHSVLFPEPTSQSVIVVEPVDDSKTMSKPHVKIDTLTVRNLVLPINKDLIKLLTVDRALRVAVNVTQADLQMDEQEYSKLLKSQFAE